MRYMMPAKSPAQAKLMRAAANNPAFAKKVGVPTKVAKEFTKERGVFAGKESKAEEAAEKRMFPGKKAYAKAEAKHEGEKYKCGGKVKKYAEGGLAEIGDVREGAPAGGRFDEDTYARARAFAKAAEREEPQPTPKTKPAVKAAPKVEPKEEVIPERKPGTGSGRGGQGGPTAEELESTPAAKQRRLDAFRAETQRNIDAGGRLGDKGPTFVPGPAANRVMTAAPRALEGATAAARPALAAPRAGATALPSPTPAAQAARVGRNVPAGELPPPRPQASQWASRESANKAVSEARAKAAKGRSSESSKVEDIRSKSRFKEDEAGMEFRKGGSIRGTGMARPKKTRFI